MRTGTTEYWMLPTNARALYWPPSTGFLSKVTLLTDHSTSSIKPTEVSTEFPSPALVLSDNSLIQALIHHSHSELLWNHISVNKKNTYLNIYWKTPCYTSISTTGKQYFISKVKAEISNSSTDTSWMFQNDRLFSGITVTSPSLRTIATVRHNFNS